MVDKDSNSSLESKQTERDMNIESQDYIAPPNNESPQSNVSGTSSTPSSTGKTFSSFSGKSSYASSKPEPSDQRAGTDVSGNPLAASAPIVRSPTDSCQSSREKGKRNYISESTQRAAQTPRQNASEHARPLSRLKIDILFSNSSACESLQQEHIVLQTSDITVVLKQNDQNATAIGSNSTASEPKPTAPTSGNNDLNEPRTNLLYVRESYRDICLPLFKAALKGDVDKGKRLLGDRAQERLYEAITEGYETVLHVATGARQTKFVKEMVGLTTDDNFGYMMLQDRAGNTAFSVAATTGSEEIANLMLKKNPRVLTIRSITEKTPLYQAAVFGQTNMGLLLYDKMNSGNHLTDDDKKEIFFMSIRTGSYHLARRLLKDDGSLAMAIDKESKQTALHLLATLPSAFAESPGLLKNLTNKFPGVTFPNPAVKLLKCLWEKILDQNDHMSVVRFIDQHSTVLLFDAAESGNFKFLAQIIRDCPSLIHQLDGNGRSIFHIALMHRHTEIFNLIYEIGFYKQLIAAYVDKKGNNLLHLAAKYSDRKAVPKVPGAALEMQQELILFKEVELLAMPMQREIKNSEGYTPRELFTKEHEELLKRGEKWMKQTATSCSLVATIIATVVFAAGFSVPGGLSQNAQRQEDGIPIHLKETAFRIFAMANAVALSSSSLSILMFLHILTSRYAENDFLWSLPLKLVVGILMLFISIVAMMISYSSSFFLAFDQHKFKGRFPVSITVLLALSVPVFLLVQYELFGDILYSSFGFRFSIGSFTFLRFIKWCLCGRFANRNRT